MSTAVEQLASVNLAISSLETALADNVIQRYRLPSGHEVQRANFATVLTTLYAERTRLEQAINVASRPRMIRGGMGGWR